MDDLLWTRVMVVLLFCIQFARKDNREDWLLRTILGGVLLVFSGRVFIDVAGVAFGGA